MKKCNNCRREFPDSDFIGDSGKEVKRCKICREASKRSDKLRAAKIKEYQKEYRNKNADKIKGYRVKNADKIKEYRVKNVDKIKEYHKEYYRKNADKLIAHQKEYYRKNIEKITTYSKEFHRLYRAKKALYSIYANKLTVDEQAESNAKGELVVRCFKCASKFVPTNAQAHNRVQALLGNSLGENHLYCSQECKDSCSIYNVKYDPAEASHGASALRNPEWAQLVKERDGFTCQKCGDMGDVQAHHIEPVALHPELSDDLDNGLTLCKSCHQAVHKQEGCGLVYLRNNKVKMC